MKLKYKVPLLVLLLMLIIGLPASVALITELRQVGEVEYKEMATSMSGAIQGALEEYMLELEQICLLFA